MDRLLLSEAQNKSIQKPPQSILLALKQAQKTKSTTHKTLIPLQSINQNNTIQNTYAYSMN